MHILNNRQSGLAAAGIAIILSVFVIIGVTAFSVYRNQHKQDAITPTVPPDTPVQEPATKPQQPLPATNHYSNDKYGIIFDYPKEWSVEEVPINDPAGPVPVEFAINVNANTADKYKAVASFEIIAKDYVAITGYYSSVYQPAEKFKVNKSQDTVSDKQVTHFTNTSDATQPPSKTEHYLYAVADKTYSLRSVNGETSVLRDADYWKKFDKLVKSVELR